MVTSPATLTGSRRERARAATIEEIKTTALSVMREQGTTDCRFTDIARLMGMTAPALYRYYGDRDELLTDLITDAYADLGTALARGARARSSRTTSAAAGWPPPRSTAAGPGASRSSSRWSWACRCRATSPPTRAPRPRPPSARCRSWPASSSPPRSTASCGAPLVCEVSAGIAECEAEKHPEIEGLVPPESFQAMLHAWASLHGFTSLEAYGHFDWMTDVDRDALFRSHVRVIAMAAGIPAPPA